MHIMQKKNKQTNKKINSHLCLVYLFFIKNKNISIPNMYNK